jgi:hypothetical protein
MVESRAHLLQLVLFSVIATLAVGLLLAFTNPASSGLAIKLMALALVGLAGGAWASFVGYSARVLLKRTSDHRPLAHSIRQGVLIAGLIIALVILQVAQLFTWWIILTVVLFILVLEIFLNI